MSGLPGEGLQLNVTKRCKDRCSCTLHPDNIIVSEEKVGSAQDFIACTHERSTPFLLQQVLGSSENQLPSLIQNVTSVTVYYWEKVPTNPLFLEVERTTGTEYYYKYAEDEPEVKDTDAKTWTHNRDTGLQLEERLDDRNCGINKAIAYDIQKDYSNEGDGATKSKCLKNERKITSAKQSSITPLGGNYTVKAYDITGISTNTRISRVTYGRASTTGIYPPLTATSQIRVYYWKYGTKEKTIPLLIEFKKGQQGSTWFANTSQASTQWKSVTDDTRNFYDTGDTNPLPALTTKLDYVNCTVNGVTVIDIGKKPESRYCHNPDGEVGEGSHTPLIQVTNASKESTYKDKIGRFVAYSHTVNPEVSKQKAHLNDKFHISGFKNGSTGITLNDPQPSLPVLNVNKFLVFWCGSGPKAQPLLFYLEYTDNNESKQREWFKKPKNGSNEWIKLDDKNGRPSNSGDANAINKVLNSYDTKCKDRTMLYILIGIPAALGPPGIGYAAYWYFFLRDPWWRLM